MEAGLQHGLAQHGVTLFAGICSSNTQPHTWAVGKYALGIRRFVLIGSCTAPHRDVGEHVFLTAAYMPFTAWLFKTQLGVQILQGL